MSRVGVISDTHGLLRPEAMDALQGCEHIILAGDIGKQGVIEQLSELAPVTAVRGNVDQGELASQYPHDQLLKVEEAFIYTLHILQELDLDPASLGYHAVISGHSHKAKIETVGSVLYLNPGSAGPRRFSLPVTVAVVEINGSSISPEIVELSV